MTRHDRSPLALAAVTVIVLAWTLPPMFSAGREHPAPGFEAAGMTAPPRIASVYDTLGRGESLARLMADNGFDAAQIHEITQAIREFKRPRTLRPGAVMRFSGPPGRTPNRLRLELNPDSMLHLAPTDSGWAARLEVVPVRVDTLRLSGVIESSLWFANLSGDVDRLAEGGYQEIVYDLADVYAWKVDFTRDIRRGDGFRVAIEREVRPDGSVRSRRFIAIELRNQDHVLAAFPFSRPGGRRAYYDADGEALRGVFLRYPVPYRITSGFSRHRFHPVLKRYRPHQGIDYGAPYGTRVQATASGTVTRAGTWGGYGRMVEIRHTGGIRTRYAHLSAIAPGVRAGARVEQGQFIGRVGATGLATGTHLHYEFIQNGAHRNPLSVSLPTAPALEKEHLAEFRRSVGAARAVLDGVPTPEPLLAGAAPEAR